jgi:phosphate transport system protein
MVWRAVSIIWTLLRTLHLEFVRESYQKDLAMLERSILSDLDLAIATLADVGDAVQDTAGPTPASIERNAERLRSSSHESDQKLITTMALQAPVASDLRRTLALIETAHHVDLIANQFDHLTAQLLEIDPDTPDRFHTGEKLAQMAELAGRQLADAAAALTERDARLARAMAANDRDVNRLDREVFRTTTTTTDDASAHELAIRQMLIARCIERIADNAVDIAAQATFIATGDHYEFSEDHARRPG